MKSRIFSTLPGIAAVAVLLALLMGLGAWLFLRSAYAEQRARALVPPVYPGAQLGNISQISASGMTTEASAYLVPGDVLAVMTWLDKTMPGFVPCPGTTKAECWMNERCDETGSSMVLRLAQGDALPSQSCVSVVLQSEVPFGARTIIRLSIGWPSDQ